MPPAPATASSTLARAARRWLVAALGAIAATATTPPSALAASPAFTAAAAAAVPAGVHSEVLEDGLELIVVTIPDAAASRLSWVIRSGSRDDPEGKEGLAHLVEHLVVEQARGREPLLDDARAAGAEINAFTSRAWTIFDLQASSESFVPLAERYISLITNLRVDNRVLARERIAVVSEAQMFGGERRILDVIGDALRAHGAPAAAIAGSVGSRRDITREDLYDFYAKHYTTANTTVVVAGAFGVEQVRAVLNRAVHLPPEPEPLVAPVESVDLPYARQLRAPRTALAYGYAVALDDERTCEVMAGILQQRLATAVQVVEPIASNVAVACTRVHEQLIVLALVYARSLSASELPEEVAGTFARLAREGPSGSEVSVARHRLELLRQAHSADAIELGHAIAQRAGGTPRGARTALDLLEPVPSSVSAAQVAKMARGSFVEERKIMIQLSPFEG